MRKRNGIFQRSKVCPSDDVYCTLVLRARMWLVNLCCNLAGIKTGEALVSQRMLLAQARPTMITLIIESSNQSSLAQFVIYQWLVVTRVDESRPQSPVVHSIPFIKSCTCTIAICYKSPILNRIQLNLCMHFLIKKLCNDFVSCIFP